MRASTGRVDAARRRVGGVLSIVPRSPNYCRCFSRGKAVVCMNGTGGLGHHISSCFGGRRSDGGAHILIGRVQSVGCFIISARRSTLLLRGGLVGRCHPQCGILLGSSGACPSVIIGGRCFPHMFRAQGVMQSNSHCCNPCPSVCATGIVLRVLGRLCPLHAYGCPLAPRSVTGNQCGMYLRCRVGRYGKPYRKLRALRRCRRGVSRVGRVLHKGVSRVDGRLCRRVRGLTKRLQFRRTRGVGRGCRIVRGCHSGSAIIAPVLRGVSMFSLTRGRGSTCVGCLRVNGKTVIRTCAFRCGGHLSRSGRRLLDLKVVRVHGHFGDATHRVVIPFPLSVRLRGISVAIPRHKSGGGLIRLSRVGIGRCGISGLGRTRGLGPRRHDAHLLGRVRRALRLPGLPTRVRYFSGSGVRKDSTMTTYIIFGVTGPSGGSCQGCGVGAIINPSSCTSVGRIMHHHCRHTVIRRAPLPSLVVASNKGKRVRIMHRIVRSRLRLSVPVTKLTGSKGRQASRLLFNFPPRAVNVPVRDFVFGFFARVRSRIRHFTVAFRGSGHDGDRAGSRLSAVGKVKRGAGMLLLHRFGDMGQVHRTNFSRLGRMVKRTGAGTLLGNLGWECRGVSAANATYLHGREQATRVRGQRESTHANQC